MQRAQKHTKHTGPSSNDLLLPRHQKQKKSRQQTQKHLKQLQQSKCLSLSPVYPDNQLGDSSIIQPGFEFENTLRDSQAAGTLEMVPAAAVPSSTAMAKAPALATTPQQHVAVQPEPVATRPLEPECVPAQPPQPDSQQPLAAPPAQPEHQQQPLAAQPPQDTQQQPDLRRLVATDQLPTPSPSEASEMEADLEVLLNKKEMKEDQKSTPFRPNPDDVKAALLRKTTVDLMPPPAVPKRTQAAAAAAAPPPPPAVAEVASAMQVAPKDLMSHTSVVMNLGGFCNLCGCLSQRSKPWPQG